MRRPPFSEAGHVASQAQLRDSRLPHPLYKYEDVDRGGRIHVLPPRAVRVPMQLQLPHALPKSIAPQRRELGMQVAHHLLRHRRLLPGRTWLTFWRQRGGGGLPRWRVEDRRLERRQAVARPRAGRVPVGGSAGRRTPPVRLLEVDLALLRLAEDEAALAALRCAAAERRASLAVAQVGLEGVRRTDADGAAGTREYSPANGLVRDAFFLRAACEAATHTKGRRAGRPRTRRPRKVSEELGARDVAPAAAWTLLHLVASLLVLLDKFAVGLELAASTAGARLAKRECHMATKQRLAGEAPWAARAAEHSVAHGFVLRALLLGDVGGATANAS